MLLPFAIVLAQTKLPLPDPPGIDFAAAPSFAYGMMPPQFVYGPEVTAASWSPTGHSILILSTDKSQSTDSAKAFFNGEQPSIDIDPPVRRIVGWEVSKKRAHTVYSSADEGNEALYGWLADSELAVVIASVMQPDPKTNRPVEVEEFSLVNAKTGDAHTLLTCTPKTQVECVISPKKPWAVALQRDRSSGALSTATARFFSANGFYGSQFTLPKGAWMSWDDEGSPLVHQFEPDPSRPNKLIQRFFSVDSSSGNLTEVAKPAKDPYQDPPVDAPAAECEILRNGLQAKAGAVWLTCKDGKPSEAGVVTTDGERAEVAESNTGVLYISRGSLYVRPMFKIARDAYNDHMKRVARAKAVLDAKQMGLAMMMYSADWDGKLPTMGPNWQQDVEPYVKNNQLMNSFNYTFNGGAMGTTPGSTMLGYVDGPDGRAVVYGDGTVIWVPDP